MVTSASAVPVHATNSSVSQQYISSNNLHEYKRPVVENEIYENEPGKTRNDNSFLVQRQCADCEKEETLHRTMADTGETFIQRKLQVSNDKSQTEADTDPALTIPFTQKTAHFNTIVQNLSPAFHVDTTSGEIAPAQDSDKLVKGTHPLGSCGLNILVKGANTWQIKMSQFLGPHTNENQHEVVLPPPNSDLQFGNFKADGSRSTINDTIVAGHELIGHAAQMEIGIHNEGNEDREGKNHHDPTVRVQNILQHEQGMPASEDRGLAADGPHRGESFGQVEVTGFDFNSNAVSSLPTAEQNKIILMANFIKANNTWVDVIGHSDSVGTDAAKQMVSQSRAESVKNRLNELGVTDFMTKTIGSYQYNNRKRFTAVKGVSDSQPPASADPAMARRVQIFAPNHPAGTENPPADIPALQEAEHSKNIDSEKASADACHKLLAASAFP